MFCKDYVIRFLPKLCRKRQELFNYKVKQMYFPVLNTQFSSKAEKSDQKKRENASFKHFIGEHCLYRLCQFSTSEIFAKLGRVSGNFASPDVCNARFNHCKWAGENVPNFVLRQNYINFLIFYVNEKRIRWNHFIFLRRNKILKIFYIVFSYFKV